MRLMICALAGMLSVVACSQAIAVDTVDTVTVRSNRTGQPLAGAVITVQGVQGSGLVTTSDGIVHLPGISAKRRMTIVRDGYLNAYTTFYEPGMTAWLIPDDTQLPYATVKNAIYGNSDTGRLLRTTCQVVTVYPDAAIRNDRIAWDALNWSVEKLNETRASLLAVNRPGTAAMPTWVIATNDQQAAEFKVIMKVDTINEWWTKPGYESAGALTFNSPSNGVIMSSTILLKGLEEIFWGDHIKRVFLHESSHALGLGHLRPSDPEGIMGGNGSGAPLNYTVQELDLLMILTARPPNNAPVDDSTMTTARVASLGTANQLVGTSASTTERIKDAPDFVEPRP